MKLIRLYVPIFFARAIPIAKKRISTAIRARIKQQLLPTYQHQTELTASDLSHNSDPMLIK